MNFLDVYYQIKPLIPRRFQLAIRRQMVIRKLPKVKHIWPIDPEAGNPPPGWKGWPEGKKFAFILTHDVEGPRGVERCQKLADIDRDLGFRSCFNFVPERCKNAVFLNDDLIANGFEVGVHGLCHKGNLFASRKKFVRKADKINTRLKEWQAAGFRSPSMYHNLDWIGELGIEYDGSTFDTDPFEPQPDGMGTIFPFWVPAKGVPSSNLGPRSSFLASRSSLLAPQSYEHTATSHELLATRNPDSNQLTANSYQLSPGYVELPYTLPQDFTLFVLMEEKTIDIWKKKLDWIVEKGGMALLITHPDYVNCNKNRPKIEEYPTSLYEEFLDYVKSNYEGQYWHALPKEIAHFWRQEMVTQSIK